MVPPSASGGSLLLGGADVEREQDRRRRVDGHRRRDLVEGNPGEQVDHVVEGVDGDALDDRPRRGCARRSSRGPSGSACRTPWRARSGRDRAGTGSARWSPPPSRNRRTGASSRGGPGTSTGRRRACMGTRRGGQLAIGVPAGEALGVVQRLDRLPRDGLEQRVPLGLRRVDLLLHWWARRLASGSMAILGSLGARAYASEDAASGGARACSRGARDVAVQGPCPCRPRPPPPGSPQRSPAAVPGARSASPASPRPPRSPPAPRPG